MSPIEQFLPAAAKDLLGVCFDIDDTVTSHGTLDVAAYVALAALRQAGLKLVAVTGRPLGFAEIVARTWLVDAAVGENGAGYIARTGSSLSFGYWDDEATRVAQQRTLRLIRERVGQEMPHVRESDDGWARRCDLAFDVNERAPLPRADVDRLVALIQSCGARALVSSVHAHAQLSDHDKARGVARALRELWGLEESVVQRRFLFVGDSGNDAAAFSWFDWTAGVANVSLHLDRLPRPPRYVARASYGEGFAEIARTILALRAAS